MAKKTLRKDRIIDKWLTIIENGAGNQERVFLQTENLLQMANLPNVSWQRQEITMGMFTKPREFLVVNHKSLHEYTMFLNVRDFGQHLDCAWFLTVQPGFLARTASKFSRDGDAIGLSVFDEQDLSAWIHVTHRAFLRTVKELMEELELDFTGMNTQSKGYLSVW
jgi:hypothetical protein